MPGIQFTLSLRTIASPADMAVWIVCVLLSAAAQATDPADRVQFNRDIRPILAANCLECHGFDAGTRKGDLRLDTPEGALTGP